MCLRFFLLGNVKIATNNTLGDKMQEKIINELVSIIKCDDNIDLEEYIDYYLQVKKERLLALSKYELCRTLISDLNYDVRNKYKSSELVGFKVKVGDICYVDFGRAYINEAGYQHFGIVLAINNSKVLIVPMSSNYSMYEQSYCEHVYPVGKKHLFRLPKVSSLKRKSVLFLNDIKCINTARVIQVKGWIDPNDALFKSILCRIETLFKHN